MGIPACFIIIVVILQVVDCWFPFITYLSLVLYIRKKNITPVIDIICTLARPLLGKFLKSSQTYILKLDAGFSFMNGEAWLDYVTKQQELGDNSKKSREILVKFTLTNHCYCL